MLEKKRLGQGRAYTSAGSSSLEFDLPLAIQIELKSRYSSYKESALYNIVQS